MVSAASEAWKLEPAMGRLSLTTWRGMPRTMWMPNLRPWLMNPVGERLEAGAVGGRGKAVDIGNKKAVSVVQVLAGLEIAAEGVLHVPAFVDDRVLPADIGGGRRALWYWRESRLRRW